jgi:hypothetical protein
MAMKPKKIISSRGESGVGAGPGRGSSGGAGGGRLSNTFGNAPKQFAVRPVKKVASRKNAPVKVKSGGDIKPATLKKTIANNPAGVGKYTKSSDSIKREMQSMMDLIQKGNKVTVNTDSAKKGIFTPLKKKLAAANTPANRAKKAAAARALKAANRNR